jgi:hypothetical protein
LKRAGVGAQIGDKRQAVGDKEWATQIATKKKNKSDIKLKKRNLGIKKELR